jgi:acid phosphatase (class A)
MQKSLIFAAAMLMGIGASAEQATTPPVQSRLGAGYLKPAAMPDALMLLPPPPADGSKALALDKKAEAKALTLHGTSRWALAITDADLFTPKATSSFSCAAGFVIGPVETPKIDAILRKVGSDFGLSTYPVKTKYQRPRPFVGNGKPVCTPDYEAVLRKDGSYPSGHAAIGFGWGMILAEIIPSRDGKLLTRGKAFADSRRVCNVHFKSDIEAGGVMAKAVFKALLADPTFQADLAAAKAEAKALKPVKPDCTAETAALKLTR